MGDLKELGYEYKDGRLVQVGTDSGFEFKNQEHYDKLADAVLRHVGTLLVDQGGLTPLALPLGAASGEPQTVVFVSEGIEKAEKVLLIIQGSGRVRVGVWGCALCINKDLKQGTMLPYLQLAAEQGYGVVVLNPNENSIDGRPVRGSETPVAHLSYVWQTLVQGRCSPTATIDIVAHSNGGRCLIHFLALSGPRGSEVPPETRATSSDAAARIRRVILTDSYHDLREVAMEFLPSAAQSTLADPTRCINYVPHAAELGTQVSEWVSLGRQMSQPEKGCLCVSAAVEDHAATNQASASAVPHAASFNVAAAVHSPPVVVTRQASRPPAGAQPTASAAPAGGDLLQRLGHLRDRVDWLAKEMGRLGDDKGAGAAKEGLRLPLPGLERAPAREVVPPG